jgi:hypothetical protein
MADFTWVNSDDGTHRLLLFGGPIVGMVYHSGGHYHTLCKGSHGLASSGSYSVLSRAKLSVEEMARNFAAHDKHSHALPHRR